MVRLAVSTSSSSSSFSDTDDNTVTLFDVPARIVRHIRVLQDAIDNTPEEADGAAATPPVIPIPHDLVDATTLRWLVAAIEGLYPDTSTAVGEETLGVIFNAAYRLDVAPVADRCAEIMAGLAHSAAVDAVHRLHRGTTAN